MVRTEKPKKSDENNKRNRKSDAQRKSNAPLTSLPSNVIYEIQRLILSRSEFRDQPVCSICEAIGASTEGIQPCQGFCSFWFHPKCLENAKGSSNDGLKLICPECSAGRCLCAFCPVNDQRDEPLITCEQPDCQRHYHLSCLQERPLIAIGPNNQLPCCPAHFCWSCRVEENDMLCPPDPKDQQKFVRCLRCPLSYHPGNLCVPAGSVELSLSQIVCPNHLQEALHEDKNHKVIHSPLCMVFSNASNLNVSHKRHC